jgi:predicted enzyme related to lactoylglutathione lyase
VNGELVIKGIRSFHYPVRDLDRALKFYSEVLGMQFDYAQPGWTALKMSGMQVGLHPEPDMVEVPRDSHGALAGGCLTLNSDDISADRKQLEAGGAKIFGEADESWGHRLVFEDPDGNVLKLMRAKY